MNYTNINTDNYQSLMQEHHIGSLLAKILSSFKYNDDEIIAFFNSDENLKYNNEVLEPIKQFILKIKKENKKVFIFGDYDCDGICATAIMIKILHAYNIEYGYYIPNRLAEGYGLNIDRLKQAKEKGYQVLITVDNGVSCQNEINWAIENNIEVFVSDHHIIAEALKCDYFLHPSLLGKENSYLCGAGVVYILACYLGLDSDIVKVLAGLATISDVMSLKGNNIKIVRDCLEILNANKYENLISLDSFEFPLTEQDLSFKIVPKINAVGRLADRANANNVVKFLLSNNKQEIVAYANQIIEINTIRQDLSYKQFKAVNELLSPNDACHIIYAKDLHPGIVGLIATKIANETNKVTFIFTDDQDGQIRGSGRGVGDVDIVEMLQPIKDNLIELGGHAGACGLTIKADYLDNFKAFLNDKCSFLDNKIECIEVNDLDLTIDNINELFKYRPYGQDRNIPLMKYHIINCDSYQKLKNDNQLKWRINGIDFLSFNKNSGYDAYLGKDLWVVGSLQENKFRGKTTFQIIIKEII